MEQVEGAVAKTVADQMVDQLKSPPKGTVRGHSFLPIFFGGCIVLGTAAGVAGIVLKNYVTLSGGIVLDIGAGVGLFVAKDLKELHNYVGQLGSKVQEFSKYLTDFKQTGDDLKKTSESEKLELEKLRTFKTESEKAMQKLEDSENEQIKNLKESLVQIEREKEQAEKDIIELERQQNVQLVALKESLSTLEKEKQGMGSQIDSLKSTIKSYEDQEKAKLEELRQKEEAIDKKRQDVDKELEKIHADANGLADQVKAFNASNKEYVKEMSADASQLATGVGNLMAQVTVTKGIYDSLKGEVEEMKKLVAQSQEQLELAKKELEKDELVDKEIKENVDAEKDLLKLVRSEGLAVKKAREEFEAEKETLKAKWQTDAIAEYKEKKRREKLEKATATAK